MSVTFFMVLASCVTARDITFPPVAALQSPFGAETFFEDNLSSAPFAGLTTYANLPHVHCLARNGFDVEPYDIAVSLRCTNCTTHS